MHMLIGVITYAENRKDAFGVAEGVLSDLAGEGKPFDYYSTPEGDGEYLKMRYGILPKTCKTSTKIAQKFIKRLMEYTTREFKYNLDALQDFLKKSPSATELMKNSQFRYHAHEIGRYDGPSIFLYDEFGSGLKDEDVLSRTLARENETRHEGWATWLTVADVHY